MDIKSFTGISEIGKKLLMEKERERGGGEGKRKKNGDKIPDIRPCQYSKASLSSWGEKKRGSY